MTGAMDVGAGAGAVVSGQRGGKKGRGLAGGDIAWGRTRDLRSAPSSAKTKWLEAEWGQMEESCARSGEQATVVVERTGSMGRNAT